jgi:hypothetical protein
MKSLRHIVFAGVVMLLAMLSVLNAGAANTITFDNQSGKPALVKLVGPTAATVAVANGAKQTTNAAAGHYTIKVRYGTPGAYAYSKGDEFDVKQMANSESAITITLHAVVNGNYGTRPISEKEFGSEEAGHVTVPIATPATRPVLPATIPSPTGRLRADTLEIPARTQSDLPARSSDGKVGPLSLDLAATSFTARTITNSVTPGLAYTIEVEGTVTLADKNLSIVVRRDSVSFVVLRIDAPTAFDKPRTTYSDLDEMSSGPPVPVQWVIDNRRFPVAATTSIGLRGQGETPTRLHPKTELFFKDKKGEYGSALLIKDVEVLALVTKSFVVGDDKSRSFVVVGFDFQLDRKRKNTGYPLVERGHRASSVTTWRLDRTFLSSVVTDPNAKPGFTEAAKTLLDRLERK